MAQVSNIQWFPGHMTKTKRQIEADLKLVDAVAEILDSRITESSRNPVINYITGSKPRITHLKIVYESFFLINAIMPMKRLLPSGRNITRLRAIKL